MSASARHLASAKNQAQAGNKLFRADPVEVVEEEAAEAGEVAEEGAPAGRSREGREDWVAVAQIAATTSRSASMLATSSTIEMPISQAAS